MVVWHWILCQSFDRNDIKWKLTLKSLDLPPPLLPLPCLTMTHFLVVTDDPDSMCPLFFQMPCHDGQEGRSNSSSFPPMLSITQVFHLLTLSDKVMSHRFRLWFLRFLLFSSSSRTHDEPTDFFQNVVTPLFTLWDQFLSSQLSKQLIANLNYNYNQWQSFLTRKPSIDRRHSMTFSRRSSSSSTNGDDDTAIQSQTLRCSRSLNELALNEESTPLAVVAALRVSQESECKDSKNKRPRPSSLSIPVQRHEEEETEPPCDGIHGCGTPSSLGSPASDFSSDGGSASDTSEDILSNHPLKTHSDPTDHDPFSSPGADPFLDPLQSSHHLPHPFAPQYWGRRGSAPGCIGFYASAELAAAALVFLQGTLNSNPRRSSAPVEANRNKTWPYLAKCVWISWFSLLILETLFSQLEHRLHFARRTRISRLTCSSRIVSRIGTHTHLCHLLESWEEIRRRPNNLHIHLMWLYSIYTEVNGEDVWLTIIHTLMIYSIVLYTFYTWTTCTFYWRQPKGQMSMKSSVKLRNAG